MMRRVGWIGVLSLVCAGMSATRMAAQNGTNHNGGSNSGTLYKRQQPAPAPRGAPAAGTKATTTNAQKQPLVQPQPAVTSRPLQTLPNQSPPASAPAKGALAAVPAQSSGSAPAPNPSDQMYMNWQPTGTRTTGSNSTPTPTRDTTGGSTGSGVIGSNSPGTAQNPNASGQGSKELPGNGSNSPPSTTKDPPATGMNPRQPPRWPPKGSQTPAPMYPRHPPKTPPPAIPSYGVLPPYGYRPPLPQQITSKAPGLPPPQTVQPSDNGQPPQPPQPAQSAQTPAGPTPSAPPSTAQTSGAPSVNTQSPQPQAPSSPDHPKNIPAIESPPPGPGPFIPLVPPVAALTLTPSPSRPVVGRKIVVVPALTPSQAGTSYQLDWGDGSAMETVTDSGTHRYAKPKLYKVSARARVGNSELNREILLQVGPLVPPWVAVLLTTIAGVGLWGMHTLVKVTTGCRWDVPKMKLLGRETYMSLSFVPDMGPAEERITFSKKRRRSG